MLIGDKITEIYGSEDDFGHFFEISAPYPGNTSKAFTGHLHRTSKTLVSYLYRTSVLDVPCKCPANALFIGFMKSR